MSAVSVVIPFSFTGGQQKVDGLAESLVERVPGLMLPPSRQPAADLDKNGLVCCLQQLVAYHIARGYRRLLVLGEHYESHYLVSEAIDRVGDVCAKTEPHWTVDYVAYDRLMKCGVNDTHHLERAIQRVLQSSGYDTKVISSSLVSASLA